MSPAVAQTAPQFGGTFAPPVPIPAREPPPDVFTPAEMIDVLQARGCKLTFEQYKALVLAIGTCTHQGTKERPDSLEPVIDIAGKIVGSKTMTPIDPNTGKRLHIDVPYDPVDHYLRRKLHRSIAEHLKHCHCSNRWTYSEDGAQLQRDPPSA